MTRRIQIAGSLTPLLALLLAPTVLSQPAAAGIRGFSSRDVGAERELEQRFRAIPRPDNLREYMRAITAEPHHAGSPGSRKVADYVLARFKSFGLDARIEEFEALMPYPTERSLEMTAPEPFTAQLKEPAVPDDPDSTDAGQLPTFNAYSADGDVTGDLVYVNYGTPDDYEQLEKLGVSVKGRIVIARYGRSWRGIKPKVAYEHGAIGCIIYSDPRDDGYFPGDTYPGGAYRPSQGVQRGSVMDMPIHPGDPLTPGRAADPGTVNAADRASSDVILKIPVLPISYGDALPLLRHLTGPVAPADWRGSLPITYHVGAGPAKVHLKLAFEWKVRPLYDVVARIPGSTSPDEWIIHGNHHDAWVNGASDPTSGNVALIETARGLGELVKSGWKPKRTIVLASWDGEEWGLLGSTEWAEKHADELARKAVAYVNSDSTATGWLSVAGSHSLQAFVNDVMRDLDDPKRPGKTLFTASLDHEIDQEKTPLGRSALRARGDKPIDALGSGSDYTAFIDNLQVASLDLGFGGEGGGGVYHSIYDSFYWFTHFSDKDFAYGAALSRTIGTVVLRLADADVLPFEFTATARTLRGYVDDIEKARKDLADAPAIDLGPIRAAIARLERAGEGYNKAAAGDRAASLPADKLAELNRLLYTSERAFRYDAGLPRRPWFKHLAYAPGFYTGYGVKTLPGIREGIEQKQWDEARAFVPIVAKAIDALATQVDRARSLIR
jgi:N-acetylated-alpha-linked acidic dipeptidase